MKSREKVNTFSQIPGNNGVSWSFLRETPLKHHLTPVLALIPENTPLNAFLFLHGYLYTKRNILKLKRMWSMVINTFHHHFICRCIHHYKLWQKDGWNSRDGVTKNFLLLLLRRLTTARSSDFNWSDAFDSMFWGRQGLILKCFYALQCALLALK